jgi:tetratricopeptide (TPR) repeat protein
MAYLMTGDTEKAGEEFALGGGDAWAVYNMARLYYQNDMFSEAREYFARALEMNPSLAGARKGWETSDTLYRISYALSENAENMGDSTMTEEKSKTEGFLPEQTGVTKRVDSVKWLEKVEVEISNGNGVRNMARNVGSYLKK